VTANNQIINNIIINPGSIGTYSVPDESYIKFMGSATASTSNNYKAHDMINVLFRDTIAGNFRLFSNSPARDAGLNATLQGVTADFDYFPRPYSALFDIGAFEYHPNSTWTGARSIFWEEPDNWNQFFVPSAEDDVLVPSGAANDPVITMVGKVCKNVLIGTGAGLTVEPGANLIITGNLTIQELGLLTNHGEIIIKGDLINHN
jgi:hypothetical protein